MADAVGSVVVVGIAVVAGIEESVAPPLVRQSASTSPTSGDAQHTTVESREHTGAQSPEGGDSSGVWIPGVPQMRQWPPCTAK